MEAMGERLKAARSKKFTSARRAAEAMGVKVSTYAAHENGQNEFDTETARFYARRLGVSAAWLLTGEDDAAGNLPPDPLPPSNARILGPVDMIGPGERIKVLGQAVGGSDGRFIFNGETMAEVFAPSQLWGVRDAYAVYVSGDSMEPRYLAGETVYVNPHMPARQGDFVVVQIIDDPDEPPSGYIKQFVSMNDDKLRLRQFNPAKDMHFPRARVYAVHKIVGSGM